MPSTLKAARTVRSPCGTETVMYSPVGDSDTEVNSGSLKKSPTGKRSGPARAIWAASAASRNRLCNSRFITFSPSLPIGERHPSGRSRGRHHVHESVEQPGHVMRTWAGFRVSLEAEGRGIGELDALVGSVEQRTVGDPHVRRQRRLVDGEAVVLAGDHHPLAVQVLDRVVGAVVAELHLVGAGAGGQAEQLVAQADAEHRQLRRQDLADGGDGV